jgi:DNA primase
MVAVAEGVETALSVASGNPNLTVFSSLGSITNFSSSDFNAQNQTIIICADNDPVNNESHKKVNRAADELADKGFNVFIAKPDEVGQDFNDVLLSRGAEAVKLLVNTPAVHRMHGHTNEKTVDRGQVQEKKRFRDVDFGM